MGERLNSPSELLPHLFMPRPTTASFTLKLLLLFLLFNILSLSLYLSLSLFLSLSLSLSPYSVLCFYYFIQYWPMSDAHDKNISPGYCSTAMRSFVFRAKPLQSEVWWAYFSRYYACISQYSMVNENNTIYIYIYIYVCVCVCACVCVCVCPLFCQSIYEITLF